jgi:hypothetical protein
MATTYMFWKWIPYACRQASVNFYLVGKDILIQHRDIPNKISDGFLQVTETRDCLYRLKLSLLSTDKKQGDLDRAALLAKCP